MLKTWEVHLCSRTIKKVPYKSKDQEARSVLEVLQVRLAKIRELVTHALLSLQCRILCLSLMAEYCNSWLVYFSLSFFEIHYWLSCQASHNLLHCAISLRYSKGLLLPPLNIRRQPPLNRTNINCPFVATTTGSESWWPGNASSSLASGAFWNSMTVFQCGFRSCSSSLSEKS